MGVADASASVVKFDGRQTVDDAVWAYSVLSYYHKVRAVAQWDVEKGGSPRGSNANLAI